MKIEISDEVIKKWEKDDEEIRAVGEYYDKLTPKKLKEIVEDYLRDYFS